MKCFYRYLACPKLLRLRTRLLSAYVIAVATLLAISALSASATVAVANHNQDGVEVWASQYDPSINTLYAATYDNFTPTASYQLTKMDWTGGYFNPEQQGQITAWDINFYTDSGGQPGTLCCSYHFSGTAQESFIGSFNGIPYYTYSADLGGICCFTAGTEYWVSVVPTLVYPPQWGWASSQDDDHFSIQDFYTTGRGSLPSDLTFTLWGDPCGTETPEPASLAMLGTGVIAAAGAARRRLFTA